MCKNNSIRRLFVATATNFQVYKRKKTYFWIEYKQIYFIGFLLQTFTLNVMIIVLHYRKKIVKPAETDFTGFWFLFFFCHSIQFIQILFFHSFYTKIIYKKKYTIFCWLWLRDDRKKYIKFEINGKVGAGFWFCSLALATFLLLQPSLSRTWLLSTNVAK